MKPDLSFILIIPTPLRVYNPQVLTLHKMVEDPLCMVAVPERKFES